MPITRMYTRPVRKVQIHNKHRYCNNYFTSRNNTSISILLFDDTIEESISSAYYLAKSLGGIITLYKRTIIGGPWVLLPLVGEHRDYVDVSIA
jgi:hypothetical protein